jgi:galactose-1-phosphate uridylyltransferase
MDLLPIHFLVDPGLNFQWPINEELSDDQIQSCSNIKHNRMQILGQYLELSKEYSLLPHYFSTKYDNRRSTNVALIERKSSRSSLNTLSKTIRRKLLHPFSSTRRFSLKHQHASLIKDDVENRFAIVEYFEPYFNDYSR